MSPVRDRKRFESASVRRSTNVVRNIFNNYSYKTEEGRGNASLTG